MTYVENSMNILSNFCSPINKNITASIDIKSIQNNINILRYKSKTDIMPILKADAYGHGLIDIAKIMRRLEVKYIGVATLSEAIMLRKSGDKGRILSWLYNIHNPELKEAMHLNIDIAICDETIIYDFISLIPDNKKIKVTIFVDTGINRTGINYNTALEAFIKVSKCEKIELVGMMSHLVCSQIKNSPIVNKQLTMFRSLRNQLKTLNINPPLVHIANTWACLNYDVSDFTLARAGGGIYGITIETPYAELQLVMSITSYIIQLKTINNGEGVGYDWTYVSDKNMRIGIIPVGYADILPRNASNKLYIYINGTVRKVLGLISMDQIVVEATETDNINDLVTIFGNGINCSQTIYDIANVSNSTPYEVACNIGCRVNKIYVS